MHSDFYDRQYSWEECAKSCREDQDYCSYWQYDEATLGCDYIWDYNEIASASASEEMIIGTADCPGSDELRTSVFGTCVENHPNMWLSKGDAFFDKNIIFIG